MPERLVDPIGVLEAVGGLFAFGHVPVKEVEMLTKAPQNRDEQPAPEEDVTARTTGLCPPLQRKIFHFTTHPVVEYKKGCKYDFGQTHTSNIREHYLLKSQHDWCLNCGERVKGNWEQCSVTNGMFCGVCVDVGECLHCELMDRQKLIARLEAEAAAAAEEEAAAQQAP